MKHQTKAHFKGKLLRTFESTYNKICTMDLIPFLVESFHDGIGPSFCACMPISGPLLLAFL